jgi:hypothetical protein
MVLKIRVPEAIIGRFKGVSMNYRAFAAMASLSSILFLGCDSAQSPVAGNRNAEPAMPGKEIQREWKTGFRINRDGTMSEIHYQEIDGFAVVEGDIIVCKLSEIEPRPAAGVPLAKASALGDLPTANNANRWPNNQVPYDKSQAGAYDWDVTLAVAYWNQFMPVKFVPRTNQTDYVRFVPTGNCLSQFGRAGSAQIIEIGSGCTTPFQFTSGAIMHEMGHAVGLMHEQSRADRDQYVQIDPDLLHDGDYAMYVQGESFYSTPYDLGSLMHYASWGEGWTHNPWEVIMSFSRGVIRNNLNRPSFFDVKAVANMYGASKMYRYRQSRLRDYTGDGLGDMAFFEPSNNSIHILSISGTTPSTVAGQDRGSWLTGFGNAGGEFQSGDFTGEGKADVVFIDPAANNLRFATSSGSYFVVRSAWTLGSFGSLNGGGQYRVGDFSGDGKADILYVDPTSNAIQVVVSNGNGFNAPTTWRAASTSGALTHGGRYAVGYFNADTKADLVTFDPSTGNYSVLLSTGNSFSTTGFSSLAGWILEVDGPADLMVANYAGESGAARDELLVADPHCRIAAFTPDPKSSANCVYGMGNTGSAFSGSVRMVDPNNFGHNGGSYFTGRLSSSDMRDGLVFVQPGSTQAIYAESSTGSGYGNFVQLSSNFGNWNGFYF